VTSLTAAVALLLLLVLALGPRTAMSTAGTVPGPGDTPIRHIVLLYQENHSFDNVLGLLCVHTGRCDGATTGAMPDGTTMRLERARDVVADVPHTTGAQTTAIDGGRMDGFTKIPGCTYASWYHCMSQYTPHQIPNLSRLARHFVISDRTFQMSSVPTWGAHLELVTADLDGFTGDNPRPGPRGTNGPGWGCDSNHDAPWQATPSDPITFVPSCVPDYDLNPTLYPYGGAYKPTPVQPIPTLMDELDAAGLRWRLYAGGDLGPNENGGYSRAICPTFAGCLYTSQRRRMVDTDKILADASRGRLPNFSVVLPNSGNSQHNGNSMARGDNWIGNVISALEDGPRWRSTAVFIFYDDCGCFYDHVPPPPGLGIRTPMVIVSPWARAHTVDSKTASVGSVLAFTEHTFGLAPLSQLDAGAYDYHRAFNFRHKPTARVAMTRTRIPAGERRYLRRHPTPEDDT
jgi:phospholipase C